MNFPTYIRTKAEANALAEDLFPDHTTALARIRRSRPDADYPFFWVEQQILDDLRALFDWLFNEKTRIYQRPRWHLFYDLATRLVRLVNDNRDAIDRHWRMEFAARDYNRRQRAAIMAGDGDGI